ncbi:MAG: hypothetical protein CVU60_01845 [Deltaproteobacteria bacterium HGW-Deltaproteobacteria-18]|jgi:hypothetical protein|nr:MAG: hypothetical protein CVU60_01845 [Deltaproteobacteria bacterium HGW-Deltaproteobacteria-18]
MTQRIVSSCGTVYACCDNYEYSFEEEEPRRHLSKEEWWLEKFGEAPCGLEPLMERHHIPAELEDALIPHASLS